MKIATAAVILLGTATVAQGRYETTYNEHSLAKLAAKKPAQRNLRSSNQAGGDDVRSQQGQRRTEEGLTILDEQRLPTWDDWTYLYDHWDKRIDASTCPDVNTTELQTHWDYNYDDFIAAGMSHEEALMQDCTLFLRERNPRALGSRMVRHAFHDSTGGFDGFVNIHDTVENGALASTQKVLLDDYASVNLPNADGVTATPVEFVLSLADFAAWAGTAALFNAAGRQTGFDKIDDTDIIPPVKIHYGRLSYHNATVDDTGPLEIFPGGLGPSGTGQSIVDYFGTHYGLTPEETTTLMGVHTFGGARRFDSGYKGMWTQTKNRFNNEYQQQLRQVLPMVCTPVRGVDRCIYLSMAGDDRYAPLEDQATCNPSVNLTDTDGRCEGWEQTFNSPQNGSPFTKKKFQWRNACRNDGWVNPLDPDDYENPTGCEHIMLNIDLGLAYDLEGHLCTAQDETDGVVATLGRSCIEGMIKSYPTTKDDGSAPCDKLTSRVLASCFNRNPQTYQYLEQDADDMETWINDFGPLFEQILAHRLVAGSTLTELVEPTPSPTATPCTSSATWQFTRQNNEIKGCNWIGSSPTDRCFLRGDDPDNRYALEACLVECGTCDGFTYPPTSSPTETPCSNDDSWQYTRDNHEVKGCNWVAQSTTDRCSLKADDPDGRYALEGCPVACSSCDGFTHPPTSSPTGPLPTSSPTETPCSNDPAFVYVHNSLDKKCGWIANNAAARCPLLGDVNGVATTAQDACGCACEGIV